MRGVAGLPVGSKLFDGVQVQTVALDELADAVAEAAIGEGPGPGIYDLTETGSRDFPRTLDLMRGWLGFPPWKLRVPVPRAVLGAVARVADLTGWLGWRAPLRSSALSQLALGISGDPSAWRAAGGRAFSPLPATLARMPATLQDRWFARLYLLLPLAVLLLAGFWIASGLAGLWQSSAAARLLAGRGIGFAVAEAVIALGSVADFALGVLVLWRPAARSAAAGMVVLGGWYVLTATFAGPDLLADPFGSVVTGLPALMLALLVHAMLEER